MNHTELHRIDDFILTVCASFDANPEAASLDLMYCESLHIGPMPLLFVALGESGATENYNVFDDYRNDVRCYGFTAHREAFTMMRDVIRVREQEEHDRREAEKAEAARKAALLAKQERKNAEIRAAMMRRLNSGCPVGALTLLTLLPTPPDDVGRLSIVKGEPGTQTPEPTMR